MDRNQKPSKTPHLHVRSVEGSLFPNAIAITGNARALLQLRHQIERALKDDDAYPFEEGVRGSRRLSTSAPTSSPA